MRICEECGAEIPNEYGQSKRYCPDCVRVHMRAAAKRRAQAKRIKQEMEQIKPPVKTILEIQREAAACGMSYGQYVASLRR